MTNDELNFWLRTSEGVNVQMPNEMFEDFNKADFQSFNHKCFAYAFYFLTSYIYRNTLYGRDTDKYSQANIIKVFTGNKTQVSYVTKADGLLDEIGYTKTTTDYPVAHYMSNGILEFDFIKDLRRRNPSIELNHSPRFSIKEPVKAVVRFDNEDCTGTFYSYQNTHSIDIGRFITIVSDDKLGHVGLFIYGYLKMMCDKIPNGFEISNLDLANVVGCSDRTIQNYTQRLEAIGFIESTRRLDGSRKYEKRYTIT